MLGPRVVPALARTADLLRDDADALDAAAAELLAAADPEGRGVLAVPVLATAAVAVRRRALLAAARSAGSPAGALSHRHALALDALVSAGAGTTDLPGGVVACVQPAPAGGVPAPVGGVPTPEGGLASVGPEGQTSLVFLNGQRKRADMGNLQALPDHAPRL